MKIAADGCCFGVVQSGIQNIHVRQIDISIINTYILKYDILQGTIRPWQV